MMTNPGSVSSAAFEVIYESVSQFTRDYARVFGLPPARNAARIQGRVKPFRAE